MAKLPQDDPSPTRPAELLELRARYPWDHRTFAPFPSMRFDGVPQTGALHASDILIGSFKVLVPDEHPSQKFLLGRLQSALPVALALLTHVSPLRLGIAGLAVHEVLLHRSPAWLRQIGRTFHALAESRGPGSFAPPPLDESLPVLFGELLTIAQELALTVNHTLTQSDPLVGLFEARMPGLPASIDAPGLLRFARGVLGGAEIIGGESTHETLAAVRASGLGENYALIAVLIQVVLRFSAQVETTAADAQQPGLLQTELFRYLGEPKHRSASADDLTFGRLPIAGPCPDLIERVRSREQLPEEFPVTSTMVREALRALGIADDVDLETAIRTGRLYIVDYALLADIPTRRGRDIDFLGQVVAESPEAARYLPAPFALFYRSDQGLLPVAIQLGRQSKLFEIFTPADEPDLWARVKTAYMCAESSYQQMALHFGACHLMLAGFAVATARQLHRSHPLGVLLRRHLRFVLWTDFLGQQLIVSPNGWAEAVYAGPASEGMLAISRRYYEATGFDEMMFPRSLERRGVADRSLLPDYPFRDDGVALWTALRAFIADYLAVYYDDEGSAMADDRELQAWLSELRSDRGAHVPGFPATVETVEELTDIVTAIVFRSSCYHSAVNYSQYDYYGSGADTPASLRADPREIRTRPLEDYLPPPSAQLSQACFLVQLASQRDEVLTDYDFGWFDDAQVWPLVARLRAELESIEADIDRRDATLGYTYEYLRPSLVAVSASV